MKIECIETFVLRVPLGNKVFFSSQAAFPERNSLLVKVTTDDGRIGWGEGGQYGPPQPVAACVESVFAPMLVGRSAEAPTRIADELYAYSRDFGQKGCYIEAISAIDIALWDLWGQHLGQPVHALIGGAVRDRVRAYATGCYYPEHYQDHNRVLSEIEAEAASYIDQGFDTLKMKVGLLPIERDAERIQAVREVLGSKAKILVDANHAYNVPTAVRMGRVLEDQGVLWFEEPVIPEDKTSYRRVRDALSVPIAGGEAEFTRHGFLELFQQECVDIAQPDLCVCGGISEWLKIQALASSYGVPVVPHVWGSGIALAAALHALAATPLTPHTANPVPLQNEPVVEFDRKHNPLRNDLLAEEITLDDGYLPVPQGPGLGITVNPDVLKQHTATR